MVPVRRGYSLQTRGFSGVSVALRFPGVHREITGVWAPNGHRADSRPADVACLSASATCPLHVSAP
jgi:hypothetical protein